MHVGYRQHLPVVNEREQGAHVPAASPMHECVTHGSLQTQGHLGLTHVLPPLTTRLCSCTAVLSSTCDTSGRGVPRTFATSRRFILSLFTTVLIFKFTCVAIHT